MYFAKINKIRRSNKLCPIISYRRKSVLLSFEPFIFHVSTSRNLNHLIDLVPRLHPVLSDPITELFKAISHSFSNPLACPTTDFSSRFRDRQGVKRDCNVNRDSFNFVRGVRANRDLCPARFRVCQPFERSRSCRSGVMNGRALGFPSRNFVYWE